MKRIIISAILILVTFAGFSQAQTGGEISGKTVTGTRHTVGIDSTSPTRYQLSVSDSIAKVKLDSLKAHLPISNGKLSIDSVNIKSMPTFSVSATNPSVSSTGSAIPSSATMIGGSDGTNLRALKTTTAGLLKLDSVAINYMPPISATVTGGLDATDSLHLAETKTNLDTIKGKMPTVVSDLDFADPSDNGVIIMGYESDAGQYKTFSIDASGFVKTTDENLNTFLKNAIVTRTTANVSAINTNVLTTTPIDDLAYKAITITLYGTWSGGVQFQGSNDTTVGWERIQAMNSALHTTAWIDSAIANGTYTIIPSLYKYIRIRCTSYTSGTINSICIAHKFNLHLPFPYPSTYASTQSGTWNINNISGTISLPTGAATEATLSTLNGKIPSNLTVTSTRLLVDPSGVTSPVSLASVPSHAVTNAGTFAVQVDSSLQRSTVKVSQLPSLPTGSNTIGALTANQSVNVAQINGVTPLMGAGNTGTGSPRVTIASDQATLPVSIAGTVTVTGGGLDATDSLNLATIKNNTDLVQGSTTSGQRGQLIMGKANTVPPALTDGLSYPIPLSAHGAVWIEPNYAATVDDVRPTYTAGDKVLASVDTFGQTRTVDTIQNDFLSSIANNNVIMSGDITTMTSSIIGTTNNGTNITTQNLTPFGTATAGSAVEYYGNGNSTALIYVSGTYTGALSLQYTIDNVVWTTVNSSGYEIAFRNVTTNVFTKTITSGATGIWEVNIVSSYKWRITALSAVTGTATVFFTTSNSPPMDGNIGIIRDQLTLGQGSTTSGQYGNLPLTATTVAAPTYVTAKSNPFSTKVDGSLRTNDTLTQQGIAAINTKVPALGQTTMSASTPVTIASNQTALPITDNSGSLTVDNAGTFAVQVDSSLQRSTLKISQLPSITIANTAFTANAGTNLNTSALALDATLTGGTAKAITRGGAKGSTTAADITSTATGSNHQAIDVAIMDASGAQITSFGGGTQYAELSTTNPATGTVALGRYLSTPPTLTNAQLSTPMLDASGNMKVNIAAGGSSSATATYDSTWTSTSMTITNLSALASSATAGWQSARVSNLSNKALDYNIGVRLSMANTSPSGDKSIFVYVVGWFTTDGGTTWYASTGGTTTSPSGSEGTYTLVSAAAHNFRLLGVLNYSTIDMNPCDVFSLSNAFGNTLPDAWSLVIINSTGAALETTSGTNNLVYYTPKNRVQR